VDVVQLKIYPDNTRSLLLKEKQHLSPIPPHRMTKERDMLLSEKMMKNETPTAAAVRGIAEELGAKLTLDMIIPPPSLNHPSKTKNTSSFSYPGLPAAYRYFIGSAIVKGLPKATATNKTFETTEYNNNGKPKRIIRWEWTPTPAAGMTSTSTPQQATSWTKSLRQP
jgi:hypothetical protein